MTIDNLKAGDVVEYTMEIAPRLTYANVLLRQDAGKAAITRGPLVYCLEEEDNGKHLWQLQLLADGALEEVKTEELNGIIRLKSAALRDISLDQSLYSSYAPAVKKQEISAITYYARYNRSIGEMAIFTRVSGCCCDNHKNK